MTAYPAHSALGAEPVALKNVGNARLSGGAAELTLSSFADLVLNSGCDYGTTMTSGR